MTMKIKIFSLFVFAMLLSVCSFAQSVIIDTVANSISIPTITIPKNDPAFFFSENGLMAVATLLSIIGFYLANLIPGFRALKLDKGVKVGALTVGIVVLLTTLKGAAILPALIKYVFASIPFWTQVGYGVVFKPLLGSSNDLVAKVAEAAVEDPDIAYDGVKKNSPLNALSPELPGGLDESINAKPTLL